jgi:hypothetical protein
MSIFDLISFMKNVAKGWLSSKGTQLIWHKSIPGYFSTVIDENGK